MTIRINNDTTFEIEDHSIIAREIINRLIETTKRPYTICECGSIVPLNDIQLKQVKESE